VAPVLRQSVSSAIAKGQTRTCTATFTNPTAEKNLIFVSATIAGGSAVKVTGPVGFTLIRSRSVGRLQLVVWYREGAPSTSSVTVSIAGDRSLIVRVNEYSGVAQSNALDKVTVLTSQSGRVRTGSSGTTAQADEVVVSCVANRYASTTQSGFVGGLTRLFENVSPQYFGFFRSNADADRCRLTVHELITNSVSSFALEALLSSVRDWTAILCTFRGGTSGPKRMTARGTALTVNGTGVLSAFGPLRSARRALEVTGRARVLPFAYQFMLNGFLVGQNSPYRVVSHDGLYGYGVRISDDDQPRGEGSLRGIDLQSARQVLFQVSVDGTRHQIEQRLDSLYRALVPRRDTDWELVWRQPGQPARLLRCRPIELPREVDQVRSLLAQQPVALRAADPRHYSAVPRRVEVPVTPAGSDPVSVQVFNDGNIPAYPYITIIGPTTGPAVTRVELVNETGLVTFDVALTLPARSALVGDMEARITGAPRSVVTLDGQSKYGSWQLPRQPFRIDPDPSGQGGFNLVYLRTEPAGAPVKCTLSYRDCWAG
jgi:hypothetical protein